jgi:hypothetical protein
MQVFIAGVMRGSRTDRFIDDQDYRQRITAALTTHVPGVRIIDPFELNPDSVDHDGDKSRQTFLTNTAKAADADVLIAYQPTTSMGTAIEMWIAFGASKHIAVISPLKQNWVIQVTADLLLPDLDSLIDIIENGGFVRMFAHGGEVTKEEDQKAQSPSKSSESPSGNNNPRYSSLLVLQLLNNKTPDHRVFCPLISPGTDRFPKT